jgi:hypothetical protein
MRFKSKRLQKQRKINKNAFCNLKKRILWLVPLALHFKHDL